MREVAAQFSAQSQAAHHPVNAGFSAFCSAMLAQFGTFFQLNHFGLYWKDDKMPAILSEPDKDKAANLVALFTMMVHAWLTHDFTEAARTRDELERLGVKVKMTRRRQAAKGESDHA